MKAKRRKLANAHQRLQRAVETHYHQSTPYFTPEIDLIAPDLYDGRGGSPNRIVGKFVPFSPDPKNRNLFDEHPVPFDTSRGIGCWLNATRGDNVVIVPAVECVLIANFRYTDFSKSSASDLRFIRDSLVEEMMRQFHDTYPANARRTFVPRSAFEKSLFVWPDCNRGPDGISFAVAFAVPQLHMQQMDDLNEVVCGVVFGAVAQMLVRMYLGIG